MPDLQTVCNTYPIDGIWSGQLHWLLQIPEVTYIHRFIISLLVLCCTQIPFLVTKVTSANWESLIPFNLIQISHSETQCCLLKLRADQDDKLLPWFLLSMLVTYAWDLMPRYLAAWSTKYKFQRWGRDSIGFRMSNPQWTSLEVGFETALRTKGTIAQEDIQLTDEDSCLETESHA